MVTRAEKWSPSRWKPADALAAVETAMRLDLLFNSGDYLWPGLGVISARKWEQAIPALKDCSRSYPDFLWAHAWLAFGYLNLGAPGAARAERAHVERLIGLT